MNSPFIHWDQSTQLTSSLLLVLDAPPTYMAPGKAPEAARKARGEVARGGGALCGVEAFHRCVVETSVDWF